MGLKCGSSPLLFSSHPLLYGILLSCYERVWSCLNDNVVISKRLLTDPSLTGDSISVLCALNRMCYVEDMILSFNVTSIMYFLNGISDNKRYIGNLTSAIEHLSSCGVLDIIHSTGNDKNATFFCTTKGVYVSDELFVRITTNELKTTLNLGGTDLLRYFLLVISTLNNDKSSINYKCGFYSIDMLTELTGYSKRTILNYNKKLEDGELLYIHRFKKAIYNQYSESLTNSSNTYGRLEDKNKVIICANEYIKLKYGACGLNDTSKFDVVVSRSVSSRYNYFLRGIADGKMYDIEYLKSLKNDCELYNAKYKKSASAKLKDISIIEKYMEAI